MGFLEKRRERRAAQAGAAARYRSLLDDLASSGDPKDLVPALRDAASEAGLKAAELQHDMGDVFRRHAEAALEDDLLSEAEEGRLLDLADAFGIDDGAMLTTHRDVLNRLVVARVNDGRLPQLDSPRLLLKPDEVVHLETEAQLMKEVKIREYRGGYAGVSFRVAKGVRFSTGGIRGRPVVVGTEWQPEDAGVLSVSSQRAVFMGQRKTIEFIYGKLVNLTVLTDGVRFHVSNRQTAPLFKVESGPVIAAVVNAAMQRMA